MDLRPVQLAELNKSEFNGAGLVLVEGLLELGDTILEVLDRGIFDLGDIVCAHDDDGSDE